MPYIEQSNTFDEIVFNADSTYNYLFGLRFNQSFSQGRFEYVNKKKIILKEDYFDMDNIPITVTGAYVDSIQGVRFDLCAMDSLQVDGVYAFDLIINGKSYKLGFDSSNINPTFFGYQSSFESTEIIPKSLRVLVSVDEGFVPENPILSSEIYQFNNSESNHFIVSLPITVNHFWYKPLGNDTLDIIGRKIVWG